MKLHLPISLLSAVLVAIGAVAPRGEAVGTRLRYQTMLPDDAWVKIESRYTPCPYVWMMDLADAGAILKGNYWKLSFRGAVREQEQLLIGCTVNQLWNSSAQQYIFNGGDTGVNLYLNASFRLSLGVKFAELMATGVNNNARDANKSYASSGKDYTLESNGNASFNLYIDEESALTHSSGFGENNIINALVVAFPSDNRRYTGFVIENEAVFDQMNVYTWTGTGSKVIGTDDKDMYDAWGDQLMMLREVSVADDPEHKHQARNRQEELFSNEVRVANGQNALNAQNYNMLRFIEEGVHSTAAEVFQDGSDTGYKQVRVGAGVNLKTSQAMGNEFHLGGVFVDRDATGYTLSSGFEIKKPEDKDKLKTLVLSSNNGSTTVSFTAYENFDLGTKDNRWEDVQVRSANAFDVTVGEGKTFHLYAKNLADVELQVGLTLTGGGTFAIDGDFGMKIATVNIRDGSTFDMGGGSNVKRYTGMGSGINISYGSLANAEGYNDIVHINANGDAKNNGAIFKAGGVRAELLDIVTAPVSLQDIGNGTLSLSNSGSSDFVEFYADNRNFSVNSAKGGLYMFEFRNPTEGRVNFDKADDAANNTWVKLDIDMSEVPGYDDYCGEIHPEDPFEGQLYFWFTNGRIYENGLLVAPEDMDEFLHNHFLIPSWASDCAMQVMPGNTGLFCLSISSTYTWYSKNQGEYVADMRQFAPNADGSLKWEAVYVNSSLTLDLTPEDDLNRIVLPYLQSNKGDGKLSVIRNGSKDLHVELRNVVEEPDVDGNFIHNPDTVFHKDIVVTDASHKTSLEKTGEGTLTLNGNLKGDAVVSVYEGTLDVRSKDSEVYTIGALEGSPDAAADPTAGTLSINGKLTVTGNTELVDAAAPNDPPAAPSEVRGQITGNGILAVKKNFTISSDRIAQNSKIVVQMDKGSVFHVANGAEKEQDDTTGKKLTIPDVQLGGLSGEGGTLMVETRDITLSGGGQYQFKGNIDAAQGKITLTNATSQILWSAGNENRDLVADGASTLILIGTEGKDRAASSLDVYSSYGNITVKGENKELGIGASTLRITPEEWNPDKPAATSVAVKSLTVEDGATLELYYNFAGANENINPTAPLITSSGDITIGQDANVVLSSLGSSFALRDGDHIVDHVIMHSDTGIRGYSEGAKIDADLRGIFLVYYSNDANLSVKGNDVVLNATRRLENVFDPASTSLNSRAGADMLWASRYNGSLSYGSYNPDSNLYKLMDWTAYLAQRGAEGRAANILAAVAGSTTPILGTAQRDALRAQMTRMRDHTGQLGLNSAYTYEELPFYHVWLEGTGHFANLKDRGDESGYKLNSWGGSVGFDVDLSSATSLGIGLTALYGDLDGGSADKADGKLDSYYLSLMARHQSSRWAHTFVASIGIDQAKLNRTVNYDVGRYETHGKTNGWGVGMMYELTYDIPMSEEKANVLQPLFFASVVRTSMSAYNESGEKDLALDVGKQSWTTGTIGLGVRWVNEVGQNVFDRSALLELRANLAQDVGDTQGETMVNLQATPGTSRKVRAAEVGSTAVQLGAGLKLPVNEQMQVYLNAGADLRAHMTTWNVTLGLKYDF